VEGGETLIFLLIVGKMFSFFPIYYIISCRYVISSLYCIKHVAFIHSFFKDFIMKRCWIMLKGFSASIEMIMWFLSLFYLCAVLHFWFVCVQTSLSLWNKNNLIMVCNPFNVLLNLVHKYFMKNFCIYIYQVNSFVVCVCVFFCVCRLIHLWYHSNTGFRE
jgi:hypothetical protein